MIPLRHRLAGLAFPPGQRRDELIGTLADAEEETGRRAPGLRESVNILRHGSRARLGRPRNRVVVPFAVLVTMLGAFAGGAVVTWLAWAFVPELPTGARATEISSTVFPGLTVYGGGEAPDFAEERSAEGGPVYGFVDYVVSHTDATRDTVVYEAGVRDRLAAAGWTLHDLQPDGEGEDYAFWAQRDGLVLQFVIRYWPGAPWYDGDGNAVFTLSRTPPDWMWWAAPAGAPIGAVIAFLVFGWASRRTDREDGLMPVLAMFYVLGMPLVLLFMGEGVRQWWRPDPSLPPLTPFWNPLFYDFAALLTGALILMTAGALVLAAVHRPYPLAGLRGFLARRPGWRRAGLIGAGVLLVVAAAGWSADALRPCGPDGLPRQPDAAQARLSTEARVYVDPASTQDERNLLQAAIGRSGGMPGWQGNERGAGAPAIGCGVAGPWFDVRFSSPGMFDRLLAEVSGLPGVLAVHRAA